MVGIHHDWRFLWGDEAPRTMKVREGPKCLIRESKTQALGAIREDDPLESWIDEEYDPPLADPEDQPGWNEVANIRSRDEVTTYADRFRLPQMKSITYIPY